jgi:hypothetical protein
LDLAVRAVAARLHHYDLDSLPADLAQLVLDELIYTASLDEEGLALFRRQHIYDLKLSDCSGVEDGWLRHLARSPLQNVSLAACSEVIASISETFRHVHVVNPLDQRGKFQIPTSVHFFKSSLLHHPWEHGRHSGPSEQDMACSFRSAILGLAIWRITGG